MVKINQLLITVCLLLVLVFAGCSENKEDLNSKSISEDSVQIQKEDGAKSETQIQEEKLTQILADGTYKETVSYSSPGGEETYNLALEIKEGKVTQIELIQSAPISEVGKKKVDIVNKELNTLLVGKSLSEVQIPQVIVSGASLTSKSFNEKLNEMKEKY